MFQDASLLLTKLIPKVAVMVWSILQIRGLFFTRYNALALAVDFLLNVGCILLATTLYSSRPLYLVMALIAPASLLYTTRPPSPRTKKVTKPPATKPSGKKEEALDPLPKKPFVTTYRGCMMVVTCVAILAVDFRIFPRRFAKVENWGTSLMDLGVGSFVFSAGLIAARPVLKEQFTEKTSHLSSRLYQSARHSLPLLVLGLVRLYSVKGLDYAEHVTEYGVHWNFFFSLGFLPPFVAIFQSLLRYVPSYAALALLLGTIYQITLEYTDLKAFILTAPRENLISQNREGIFSFFGYLAIFLVGQATGMYALPRTASNGKQRESSYQKRVLGMLAGWSFIWSILYLITTDYRGCNLTVSRRMANLPYVLWVSAFNCGQLFAFCALEAIFFPKASAPKSEEEAYQFATSKVLHAFNRNGLAVFLVANLLTGLVNLTVDTLLAEDVGAMVILIGYCVAVTGVAVGLDALDVTIKL